MMDDETSVTPHFGAAAQGEIVSIAVGPEKKTFRVHKEIICHYSEYFRTAYNGRWKDAAEGVALEDVDVEVFNLFVHWLYTQQPPATNDDFLRIAGLTDQDPWCLRVNMLRLKGCVFGDRFLVHGFYADFHNIFVDLNQYQPPLCEEIIYAFANLPKDALLLKDMVNRQCLWSEWEDSDKEKELVTLLPHDFLVQVMFRNMELRGFPNFDEWYDACLYHVHESNEARKKCRRNT